MIVIEVPPILFWQKMQKDITLHAHAAHHLVGGGQVTVCGEGSSTAFLQLGMVQVLDVTCRY